MLLALISVEKSPYPLPEVHKTRTSHVLLREHLRVVVHFGI